MRKGSGWKGFVMQRSMNAIGFAVPIIAAPALAMISTPPAHADLLDSLLAYWSFDDETANDGSCNDHNGVSYGAEPCPGVFGQGMCFNEEEEDYIDIPDSEDFAFNNQSLTFCTWVQVEDDIDHYRPYVSLGKESHTEPNITLAKSRSGHWEGRIYMEVYLSGAVRSAVLSDLTGEEWAALGCWIHVAGVYDAADGSVHLYINANPQHEYFGQENISYDFSEIPDLALHIGKLAGLGSSPWHQGPLDEVRIYDRALSAEEIRVLYRMHNPYPTDLNGDHFTNTADLLDLLAHWGACP